MIKTSKVQNMLTLVWVVWGAALAMIVFVYDLSGRIQDDESVLAWQWYAKTILPYMTLVVGALLASSKKHNMETETPILVFRVTVFLSVLYLLFSTSVLVARPLQLSFSPTIQLLASSSLYLSLFSGMVTASLGYFFVSTNDGEDGQK